MCASLLVAWACVPVLPLLWVLSVLPGSLFLLVQYFGSFSPFPLFFLSARAECGWLLVVFWLPFCNEVSLHLYQKEKKKLCVPLSLAISWSGVDH
jgi:hypothetical protein